MWSSYLTDVFQLTVRGGRADLAAPVVAVQPGTADVRSVLSLVMTHPLILLT